MVSIKILTQTIKKANMAEKISKSSESLKGKVAVVTGPLAQILQEAGKQPTGSSKDEEEARKILIAKTPLGVPWIEPEEIARVVVFLVSDAARMISGATFDTLFFSAYEKLKEDKPS